MEAVITAVIGVVCTGLSSFITWLLTRRKYNTEVDHNSIENMDNSLEFYNKLSNSNNKILEDILERSEKLAESNLKLLIEVQNLRAQVDTLVRIIQNEVDNIDFSKYGVQLLIPQGRTAFFNDYDNPVTIGTPAFQTVYVCWRLLAQDIVFAD